MCIYDPQVQLTLELKDLTLIIIIDHNMVTVHNMAIVHNMGIIIGPNMLSIGFEKACGYQIIQLSEEPWTIGTFLLHMYLHFFYFKEKSCFVVFFHEWNEYKNPQFNF